MIALSLLACQIGEGAYFRDSAINRILGGRWTDYRQEQLNKLVQAKFIETFVGSAYHLEITFYRLSPSSYQSLSIAYEPSATEIWHEGSINAAKLRGRV